MKKFIAFGLCIVFLAAGAASCTVVRGRGHAKSAPPGQVKKATGAKSAKAYAPGQRKK